MSPAEMAFLGLVILAFLTFGITLAVVTRYERAGAAERAAKAGRTKPVLQDSELRRAV